MFKNLNVDVMKNPVTVRIQ